ncbi:MAG: DUF4302 domain-containing protein [Muribaculaceae bacterium]|nr:DUF4302 domain-containing protein [Muribaculaceae bacterium]
MKTKIYLSALAALALTACSNDGSEIFDQSAADRLEQYKKEYAEVLTADGGLWAMEYFSNPEEPGYVFVMKFDKDGSVNIAANHKWIGGQFKQETSIWKMIADNGPVLSFNSYNTLFHIFADPANITGPYAPEGESGDINETGYGHEGDYEFQFMEVSEDGKTVRLLGKKRLYDIFLHRLDPSTDIQDYLERSAKACDFVSPYFGYLNMVAPDGEEFVVTDLETGVASAYPKQGDAVSQTRTANGIFTIGGFRFMNPFEVPRANEIDNITVESFDFQPDGSLLSADGFKIVGPYASDVFLNKTLSYSWNIDLDDCGGNIASKVQTLVDGIKEAYPTRNLESVFFGHEVVDGELVPCVNVKISGTKAAAYYISYTSASEDGFAFEVIGSNSQASTIEKKTTALTDFAKALSGVTYTVSSSDIMMPEVLDIKDKSNDGNYMVVKVN